MYTYTYILMLETHVSTPTASTPGYTTIIFQLHCSNTTLLSSQYAHSHTVILGKQKSVKNSLNLE